MAALPAQDVEVAYELRPPQRRRASSPDRTGVTDVLQAAGLR